MKNKDREYSLLLERYNNILSSPYWKRSERIRKTIDRFRHKDIKSGIGNSDAFENLLNEYEDLQNSKFWRITKFSRKLDNFSIRADHKRDLVYNEWIEEHEKIEPILNFDFNPKISIITPVYNTKKEYLRACIDSVLNQTYQNFELVLIDDCSTQRETINTLSEFANNSKIKLVKNIGRGGVSNSTNIGIDNSTGDYICFLDHDDLLAENALYEIVKALNTNIDLKIIYSDEDRIDAKGEYRYDPVFKPNWSPDRLLNDNYICHLTCYEKELVKKVGYFDTKYDGAQDYDYVLKATELVNNDQIHHISKVLYHWRMIKGSTALDINEKPYVIEATKNVKLDTIKRRKYNAHLDESNNIFFDLDDSHFISVIIPSKDNPEVLKKCVDSFVLHNKELKYEIIVVDNGSKEENRQQIESYLKETENTKYIYSPMGFNFSKMCNIGANESKGNLLLFLNDDIEIVGDDTVERLTGICMLEHVGSVGVKMYYPDSVMIQHCGVVNTFPGPNHCLLAHSDINGYNHNFNRIVNNTIAVTGAFMMISKEKFNNAGGFDEKFNNNYNDVDLCFRLYKSGLFNVAVNDRFAYHYESLSRGEDDMKSILFEVRELYNKHPDMYLNDPFYNDNFEFGSINFNI